MKFSEASRARRTGYYIGHIGQHLTDSVRQTVIGALDHTLGQHCALCAQPVPTNERADNGWPNKVCHWCIDSLPGLNSARCPTCAIPVLAGSTCQECRVATPAFFATHVLSDYAPPIDQMLQQFKYASRLSVARTVGQTLCQRICDSRQPVAIELPAWPELIVPVPLSPKRLRERGYNQAALLARDIGKRLAIAYAPDILVRVTDLDGSQTNKTRAQRLAVMRGQFRAKPHAANKRVLLVDDVMTTGATVNAAATALLNNGATSVRVVAVARTA
jgi:ComF family protein